MASLDNYRKYSSYKNALSNYITARDSAKRAAPVEEKTEKRSELGIIGRLLATGGDLLGNVVTGAAKGVEGIADAAMGVVGGIGGIFDKDFQRDVRQAIEYDATNEWLGEGLGLNRVAEQSFANESEILKMANSVASGVGQMLPAVAVSLIPGLGQAASAASLATMGVSAAGSGTEEAFKDGADYDKGLLYGAVSGATEVVTEKLFGALTKGLTGKGVLDFSKEVADQGAKRVIKGAIEEGTEELVSHGVNPLAKAIYKGKDALKEYGTADYYKEGAHAFLAGAGTGMVYSGTVGKAINRAKGLNEDISAAVDANENIQKKLTRAQDNNRLTDSLEMQAAESRMQNLKSIEAKLQSTDAQTRERYIKNYRLGDTFNPDGSLKAEILAQESRRTTGVELPANPENGENSTTAALDSRYYSTGLRGEEQRIIDDLAQMSAETGEDIHVHTEELSDKAQENLTKFKKALTSMNEHRGESENYVNYVIVNPNSKFNGAERHGNTIYIAADALERDASASYLDEASRSGNFAGTLMHEYEHTNEIRTKDGHKRTAADLELLSYLEQDPELVKAAEERVYSDYGISSESIENIRQKKKNGIELTAEEKQRFATFDSEYGATLSEYAFGNEYVMRRLVIQNEPLVERIIGKLGDLKARLAGKSDGYSRAQRKRINKALDLSLKAAEAAGKKNLAMRIMAMREEDEEAVTPTYGSNTSENTENEAVRTTNGQNMHVSGVDTGEETRYNRKRIYIQIPRKEYAIINSRIAEDNSKYLARNIELPRYGVVRSANNFYVYENFNYGNFGVLRRIPIIGNENYITAIAKKIGESNGKSVIASTNELNRMLKILRNHSRRNNNHSAVNSSGRTNSGDGRLSIGESQSSRSENNRASSNDIGDVNVNEKTKFALKSSSETVAMSKGEAQKRKANYESDRVYSKADVTKVIESIKGFDSVKPKARNELIDDIWNGLNSRYSSTQRERYIEMMSNRAFWTVMQESGTALDTASQEEIYAIERDIHSTLKDVLEHGRPSIKSNLEAKFNASDAGYWKKQRDLAVERFKIEGQLMAALKKTRENKVGEFLKSHQYKSKDLRSTVEQLTRIDFRGNLNKSGTRGIIKKLSEWYVADNPMLKADKSEEGEFTYNRYDNNIAFLLSKIAGGEGGLSNVELGELLTVVTYFNGFVEGYKRVRKNGKYIDAIPHAKKHVENIKKHAYVRVGWVDILFKSRFAQAFFRPKTLATRMDMGNEGFYNETLNEFRQGLIAAGEYEYQMMSKVEKFSKDNKKYFKELSKRKIMFDGNEMPVDVAMSLYMTTKREQARAALEESGFRYNNERVVDYESHGGNSSEVERIRSEVYRQLSDTDKAFIELAEKIFNEDCKNLKSKADIELHYYTNVLEGYYYPIYRAFIAKTVDSDFENLIKGAENQSFNKSTSDKANSFLRIMPLTEVLGRHVRGVSQYAGLSGAIRNYDITYNINVEENSPRPVTVASESEKVWKNGNKYFKELLSDMLGRSEKEGAFLSALRGSYATYQLGANPKTLATQMSSLFAATSELSYGSIVKGLTMDGSDVDKYCTLAKLRNANNDAILAQVNTNRPGLFNKQNRVTSMAHKAGEVLMTPIGWVDRFVVEKLFPACQVEVEAKGGAKVGTENNKVEAGKMLEQVIFNTQQNALATEKSAAMRSSNTIIKTTQMFGSDAMNTLGQSIDAAVEYAMLGALKKKTTDKAELDDIEKRRKAAGKRLGRSMGALVTSSIFMVVVACLFNALYHRIKDEDEDGTYWDEIGNDALVGFIGNMLGGIPILRDVFDSIGNGYAVDGYAYSMLNDAIESVTEVRKFLESAFTDQFDGRQAARTVRNVIYSFGQFFGIPTRNMYNITYSVLGFFPSVKYGIDSAFYEPAYSKDIKMAIEAGDETALSIVIETMTGERIGAVKSDKVREELNSLTLKGYSVLPRAIADSVTVGEETITLTNTQKKQFKEIYGIANETLESLVKLKGYDKVSEEVRAKSIKMIYDIYYDLALENLTGVDSENKNVLFAEAIDIEELALIASQAKALTADKDKNGNIISGTKKAKVEKLIQAQQLTAAQKYMIMGYLGYTNKNGRAQVVAYINRLKLTKEEKALLLKYSGYN